MTPVNAFTPGKGTTPFSLQPLAFILSCLLRPLISVLRPPTSDLRPPTFPFSLQPLAFSLSRPLYPLAFSLSFLLPAHAAPSGLSGSYYDNSDFTSLKFTRTDPAIDFNWATSSPSNTIAADTFSVRWSGQIEPRYSETYLFHVTADDGARLWVNNRLILSRTTFSAAALEMSGRIPLQAGQRYDITLEFIEGSGNAHVKLEWSSDSQPRETIPQSRLFPSLGLPETGSVLAETWLNLPGTNTDAILSAPNYPNRPDTREFLITLETLQPNWADNYASKISGFILPRVTGEYLLAVAGADACQLYLSTDASPASKQLVASNNLPTAFRQFTAHPGQISATIPLVAHQKYYIELLHKAAAGPDHFSVAWQPPGAPGLSIIPADVLVPAGLDRSPPAQTAYLNTLSSGHPRILASPQRFEWLKQTLAANSIPQLNSWFNSISNSASSILSQPVNTYSQDVRGTILATSRSVIDRVSKLALTWHITRNNIFADRAWTELAQVASSNFPDWHPAHFLDTAEMTHACAIGYDWLYHYWSQSQRDVIRNAIITKGLNASLNLYTNNSGWTASSANNWNLVCNGGMILGALAVGTESEPVAEYVLFKAVSSASNVMRHYTTDNGGWYEGPGYWDYTTDYNIRLMAALESALGSDLGLSDIRTLWETGLNPIYMVGPNRLSFNYADAGAGNMRGPQLFWLARRFNRPEFSWYQRANASGEVHDLLWYDARGLDPAASGLQPDNYFRGPTGSTPYNTADALTLRSSWLQSDASFLGFKGGEMGASHGNLDAGSFVFDALGVRWVHDLGGDNYALPGYFSNPQRWTYYRLRAEGHNTLVINPGSAADQTVGSKPPVILYTTEPSAERSAAVVDLSSSYPVSKVWRGVQLLNNRRWALVQDEIQAGTPATAWWFMHIHTNSNPVISPDASSVMLTQGSARLWVKRLTPEGSFTLRTATPLPSSPNPSGQNENAAYRKLALQFTGVTNSTLAVLLVPLRLGEAVPTNLPPIIPLNDWGAPVNTNNFATPTNNPPVISPNTLYTPTGTYLDLDLRNLVQDLETPSDRLLFSVSSPTNGSVTLLPNGYTARFIPPANFSGPASFDLSAADAFPDDRLVAQYDFEPPEDTSDALISDQSLKHFAGLLTTVGSGTNYLLPDSPAALAPYSTQSILLREAGDFNGSSLTASVYPSDLNLTSESWTIAGWFKRASTANDDFVLYIGSSDGFGSPDEFQLYCPSGQTSLALRHYIAQTTTDLDLSAPNIRLGEWNHFAITFLSTNANSGQIRFYVNGALAGFDPEVTLNMTPGWSVVFGGHASSTFAVTRWFNGRLDDLAVFKAALSPAEIARLLTKPALYLGGSSTTRTMSINIVAPNLPPIASTPNLTNFAGSTIILPIEAEDPNSPPQSLNFSLLSAPPNASINPDTGLITWPTTPNQSGSSNYFQIVVAQNGWSTNLLPLADTFARDGSSANLNFGSDPNLTVKLGSLGLSREAFLKFPAPPLPGTLANATLTLNPVYDNVPTTHLLGFVADDSWTETGLTWNTKPSSDQVLATWLPNAFVPVQIPLAPLYTQELAGDQLISLRIYATNTTSDGRVDYASKEAGSEVAPVLRLLSTNWASTSVTQSFWVKLVTAQPPVISDTRMSDSGFEFLIDGPPGLAYTVQASTNLTEWTPFLLTNPPATPFQVHDPDSTHYARRFFRVLIGP